MAQSDVDIIGGGLAGCEAALYLSERGVKVTLYEAKPLWRSAAHKSDALAEIVCSNSLKSTLETTASGALKNELAILGCSLLKIAYDNSVPAGGALAVDRDAFSAAVTARVKAQPNIEIVPKTVKSFDTEKPTIVCAGPVCHDGLAEFLRELTGEDSLSFFDAAAPIITADCVDMSSAFAGARYGKGGDDYINCPMTKDEYLAFHSALVSAERVIDEVGGVFEGCMPVEVMAARGVDALRYGPLRPVGFDKKYYAVLQLRRENAAASLYNLVGFQTNLKFGEQKRVFSMIPALKNIDIVRYGVMHRNTFIAAPKVLADGLSLKNYGNVYIAGQLCGVEGYVESIAMGLMAAIQVYGKLSGRADNITTPPSETIIGALLRYLHVPNSNFQPMNANFGILPQIGGKKADRKRAYYDRSDVCMREWAKNALNT